MTCTKKDTICTGRLFEKVSFKIQFASVTAAAAAECYCFISLMLLKNEEVLKINIAKTLHAIIVQLIFLVAGSMVSSIQQNNLRVL